MPLYLAVIPPLCTVGDASKRKGERWRVEGRRGGGHSPKVNPPIPPPPPLAGLAIAEEAQLVEALGGLAAREELVE